MSNPPMYQVIADELAADIRGGRLSAGDRLPGHVKLARRYGVSVLTSNRALSVLAEAGLVERRSRSGTFVREQTLPRLRRILIPASAVFQRLCPQVLEYLDGVLTEATAAGLETRTESTESRFFRSPETIRELDCQGIIQLGHPPLDVFPYHPLLLSKLPYVAVGVEEGPADYFANEDVKLGTRLLVDTLREARARAIGFVWNPAFANHRLMHEAYLATTGASDAVTDRALVRDADATTVLDQVKALQGRVDALIVAGSVGTHALSYLRATGSNLPLGLFMEHADMLPFEGQAYFVHLDHREVGRESVRLLSEVAEGTVTTPTVRRLPPRLTRPR